MLFYSLLLAVKTCQTLWRCKTEKTNERKGFKHDYTPARPYETMKLLHVLPPRSRNPFFRNEIFSFPFAQTWMFYYHWTWTFFLFFASRASLVLRWVQQSSGTCFNCSITCIWIQLRLHNNLILISTDFLMETLRSRMMTSRNTIFFLFLDCEFTLSTYFYRVIRQIFYEKRKRKLPCDGLFSRFPFHFIF